ncbi:MAG: hypothetical protein F4151_11360 [Gammaproteobacteria bacterium]|nr:hypothetical protein [Gammaproteobacteria bacterium]
MGYFAGGRPTGVARFPRPRVLAGVLRRGPTRAPASPVAARTPSSTDGTPSGRELSQRRISSAFAGGVASSTVTPTTADPDVTVPHLDGSDAALTDADTARGLQVDLDVGQDTSPEGLPVATSVVASRRVGAAP